MDDLDKLYQKLAKPDFETLKSEIEGKFGKEYDDDAITKIIESRHWIRHEFWIMYWLESNKIY